MEILIAHLVGDYILQSDWMAENKKKSNIACLIHTIFYVLPFLLISYISLWQIIIMAIQHYYQDRYNFVVWFMKVKGSPNFAKSPMTPWSIILTDNILHLCFIYFLVRLF